MWIKSKDDLRSYSLEELEEMCPKGIRLFVRLKKLKYGYRNPTGFRRWVKVAGSGGLCYTCVMETWKSKNRHKYLLQYQIIFVCKYRKKLLMSKQISDDIKQFSYEICQKHKVIIRYMETDKEHTFWTDGYFVCSVGNVSGEMPRKYIENQG